MKRKTRTRVKFLTLRHLSLRRHHRLSDCSNSKTPAAFSFGVTSLMLLSHLRPLLLLLLSHSALPLPR